MLHKGRNEVANEQNSNEVFLCFLLLGLLGNGANVQSSYIASSRTGNLKIQLSEENDILKCLGFLQGDEATLCCGYRLKTTNALYFPSRENPPICPLLISDILHEAEQPKLLMPLVLEISKPYQSILDPDLFSAPGL